MADFPTKPSPASPDHAALDAAMDARRDQLNLVWKEVAEMAGISEPALYDLRAGRTKPMRKTLAGVEDALRWERGSIRAVLSGGNPTPQDAAPAGATPPPPGAPASAGRIEGPPLLRTGETLTWGPDVMIPDDGSYLLYRLERRNPTTRRFLGAVEVGLSATLPLETEVLPLVYSELEKLMAREPTQAPIPDARPPRHM